MIFRPKLCYACSKNGIMTSQWLFLTKYVQEGLIIFRWFQWSTNHSVHSLQLWKKSPKISQIFNLRFKNQLKNKITHPLSCDKLAQIAHYPSIIFDSTFHLFHWAFVSSVRCTEEVLGSNLLCPWNLEDLWNVLSSGPCAACIPPNARLHDPICRPRLAVR